MLRRVPLNVLAGSSRSSVNIARHLSLGQHDHGQNDFNSSQKYFGYSAAVLGAGFGLYVMDDERQRLFDRFQVYAATVNGTETPTFGNDQADGSDSVSEGEHDQCTLLEAETKKRKKKMNSFRRKRIIEYENRLRIYSTPDKTFRYFATVKYIHRDGQATIYMTPEDFVRSLTPAVMQPRKYGLDRYRIVHHDETFTGSDESMIFHWIGKDGLIAYEDYLFLMTLLSTSPNDFRLAFSVYDVNGDGLLDKQEFERVQGLVLKQSSIGQKHRDTHVHGMSFKKPSSTSLTRYFFGKNQDKKLTVETFLKFQQSLHHDILRIEFERRDPESHPVGVISERSFAGLLLIHAGLPEKRQDRMMKRVKKRFRKKDDTLPGISMDECFDYFTFIYHIDRVDTALHFYKLAGRPLDKALMKKVAKRVAGVDLTDHVLDVVVTMFDENGDGFLSQNEFVSVMTRRMNRGLQQPKDTGLFRMYEALLTCSKRQLNRVLFPSDV